MVNFVEFLKTKACGQTVLPDRTKLMGNANIEKFNWDIFGDFQTMWITLATEVSKVTINETFWSQINFQVDSKENGDSPVSPMYSPLLCQPSKKNGVWPLTKSVPRLLFRISGAALFSVNLRLQEWTASKSRWKAKSSEACRPKTCLGKSKAGILVSASPHQPGPPEPPDQYLRGVKAIDS